MPSGNDGRRDRHSRRLAELATGMTHVTYVLGLQPAAHVRFISPALVHLVGYTPAEFVADPDLAFGVVNQDDLSAAAVQIREALPGQLVQCTIRVTARDGATRWTHHRLCTEQDPDGSVLVFGAARNETEHVLRARELAASRERLRLVLENVGDVVLDLTPDRRLQWVSASVERVLGWTAEDLIDRDPSELVHPDDHVLSRAARQDDARAGEVRFRVRCADGSYKWVAGISREVRDNVGVLLGHVVGLHDVDEIVRAEQSVLASERFFRVLAENSADVVFRSSADDTIVWTSPSIQEVLGMTPAELVGSRLVQILHPDDRPRVLATTAALEPGQPLQYAARAVRPDGAARWLDVRVRDVLDEEGHMLGRVGSARDIDAEVAARTQLIDSEQRARGALDSAPVGTAIADLDRRFIQVNAALCRMLDRDESWLLAHGMPDVLDDAFDEVDRRLRDKVRTGRAITARGEHQMVRADGSRFWVEHSVGVLLDDRGESRAYVCQFVDISESKRDGERLAYRATHDSLTQLLTRQGLMEGLERFQSHPPRSGGRLGMVFLDVDNLKKVNDGMGHVAGDAVLVEIARRIRECARADDLVARLGGDELVVALPDVQDQAAPLTVAEKIRARLLEPVELDGRAVTPTVSIGVAVAQPGEDAQMLIRHADLAMYRAKRAGRGRVVAFDAAMDAALPSDSRDGGTPRG